MQNLDNSITDMYFKGYIDRDEAIMRSSNPAKMEKTLEPVDGFEVVQPPQEVEEVEETEEAAVLQQ
jgi:hypothetical protein